MPKKVEQLSIVNPHGDAGVDSYFKNYEIDPRIQPVDPVMRMKLTSNEVVVFQHQDPQKVGPVASFSNFSSHPVTLPDVTGKIRTFPTSEHYFQMAKLDAEKLQRKYNTPEKLDKFFAKSFEMKPKEIYEACRPKGKYKKLTFIRSDEQSEQDMRKVIAAKFSEHPEVLMTLLATGNKEIVEVAHYDNKWGIGKDGDGQNLLGVILQETRDVAYRNVAALAGEAAPDQANLYNSPEKCAELIGNYVRVHKELAGITSTTGLNLQGSAAQKRERIAHMSVYQPMLRVSSGSSQSDERGVGNRDRSGSTSFEELGEISFVGKLGNQRGPIEQFKRDIARMVKSNPLSIDVDITAAGDFLVTFTTPEQALKFALGFQTAASELSINGNSILINSKHIEELNGKGATQCTGEMLVEAFKQKGQQNFRN